MSIAPASRSRTSEAGNLRAISIMARYWVEIPAFSASFSCDKQHFRRFSRKFFERISFRLPVFSINSSIRQYYLFHIY
jgi:hypothetical protein